MEVKARQMFKKHTYLKIEFLPDGRFLIKSNLNKKTNASAIADFINGLLTREYLEGLLESILAYGKKNSAQNISEEVCNRVMLVQKDIRLVPVNKGRNPLVKPTEVMRIDDENN